MEEMNPNNEKKSEGGCFKGCFAGLAIFIIIIVVGGWFIYNYITSNASSWAAKGVEKIVEVVLDEIPLTKSDRSEILKPVNNFCNDLRDNKVSMKQGLSVMNSVFTGPVVGAIMMMGFEKHFVEPHKFKEKENKEIHLTVNRYRQLISSGQLNESKIHEVFDKLTVKYKDNGQKKTRLKDSLTIPQLNEVLALMKKYADKLKIPNKVEKIDVGIMIEEAIKKGLAKKIE